MRLVIGSGKSREHITFASGRKAASGGGLTKAVIAVMERRGVKLVEKARG